MAGGPSEVEEEEEVEGEKMKEDGSELAKLAILVVACSQALHQ